MAELLSTRGNAEIVDYTQALINGQAPDGGLYVPTEYPRLTYEELVGLKGLSYQDQFYAVKQRLIGEDIPLDVQRHIANEAYSDENFPAAVSGNIVPVTAVGTNLYIANLSLGPTAAFKDMAMQPLARDTRYVLANTGERIDYLGMTSGDTGSAAEAAFKSVAGVRIFMMSPVVGMSPFQSAQMGALSGGNIFNISYDGSFDDCNRLWTRIQEDPDIKNFGAVNSINWGRVISQVPYYFSAYLQTVGDEVGQEVDVVVPTGNVGNVLAAHIARKMGLPIRTVIAANNENAAMDRLVQQGVYTSDKSEITSSPSMDIKGPKNFERLLYEMMEGDTSEVRSFMERVRYAGQASLAEYGLPHDIMKRMGFDSGVSGHEDRVRATQETYRDSGYAIDPHTADAVSVVTRRGTPEVPTICMETALPVKFETFMNEALGFILARPDRFVALEEQVSKDAFTLVTSYDALKAYLLSHQ